MFECTQRTRVCGGSNEKEQHHLPTEYSDNRGENPPGASERVDSMVKIRPDHVEADAKVVQEKLTLLAAAVFEKSQQESSLVAQQPLGDITSMGDIISKVQDEIRQQLQPLFKQQEELSQHLTQTIEGRLNGLQASADTPQTQVQVNVHAPPSVTAHSDGQLNSLEQRFENMVMAHEQLEQRLEKMAMELKDAALLSELANTVLTSFHVDGHISMDALVHNVDRLMRHTYPDEMKKINEEIADMENESPRKLEEGQEEEVEEFQKKILSQRIRKWTLLWCMSTKPPLGTWFSSLV